MGQAYTACAFMYICVCDTFVVSAMLYHRIHTLTSDLELDDVVKKKNKRITEHAAFLTHIAKECDAH